MEWMPEVLVLGPGGMKGFLELGALLVLEKEKILDNINRYIGVSVGAIIALHLLIGFKVDEIISIALDTSIFEDITNIDPKSIKKNGGIISNHHIRDILISNIKKKLGFIPTMKQLYSVTQCNLVCVTMNIDKDEVEYISHETEPSLSCIDAVLMSMNIPLLFYKIKFRDSIYIDGAFGNPYPIDYYDDGKTNILGIYIKSKVPDNIKSVDDSNIWYIYKILFSSMNQNREIIMKRSSDKCRHLELLSSTVDTSGITLDHKAKADMISCGYHDAYKFLAELRGQKPTEMNSDELVVTITTTDDLSDKDKTSDDEDSDSDVVQQKVKGHHYKYQGDLFD